jgi:two-component system, OmpR family, alkaline phosphatase synthesis response regulator PhoP
VSNPHRILIIEDEPDIADILKYNLERERYQVSTADSGEEGLTLAQETLPDLILLDLMLPGMDGLEVCRKLREDPRTRDLLVIMLTAKGTEADIVVGLTLGADDYIVKPFSTSEVIARVKAVLRRVDHRTHTEEKDVITAGNLSIDLSKHEARIDGKTLELTLSEFKLLSFLMRKQGRVFTRNQLLDAVVGPDVFVTERNIDVHVASLRKKLGKHGSSIITVRGVGYRFEEI